MPVNTVLAARLHIGTHCAELGDDICTLPVEPAYDLFCIITFYGYGHSYSQPVSGYSATCTLEMTGEQDSQTI
ncbi:hypothetical protein DMT38_26715 [Klebsiella variicola]|nr:hypothetical protein DMT38_26715 [Klebsiella variicola]